MDTAKVKIDEMLSLLFVNSSSYFVVIVFSGHISIVHDLSSLELDSSGIESYGAVSKLVKMPNRSGLLGRNAGQIPIHPLLLNQDYYPIHSSPRRQEIFS